MSPSEKPTEQKPVTTETNTNAFSTLAFSIANAAPRAVASGVGTGLSAAKEGGAQAMNYARNNPKQTVGVITVGIAGGAVVAAPALLTAPVLGAVGFGPGGVVSGSIAAGVQSGIGNVAGGSFFSMAQSAAAGGPALAAVNGVVPGVGGAAAERRPYTPSSSYDDSAGITGGLLLAFLCMFLEVLGVYGIFRELRSRCE